MSEYEDDLQKCYENNTLAGYPVVEWKRMLYCGDQCDEDIMHLVRERDEARKLYSKLTSELAQLREQTRWHPYPDEKPTEEGFYQATYNNGMVCDAYYFGKHSNWRDFGIGITVIAFRELPEPYQPPKETK